MPTQGHFCCNLLTGHFYVLMGLLEHPVPPVPLLLPHLPGPPPQMDGVGRRLRLEGQMIEPGSFRLWDARGHTSTASVGHPVSGAVHAALPAHSRLPRVLDQVPGAPARTVGTFSLPLKRQPPCTVDAGVHWGSKKVRQNARPDADWQLSLSVVVSNTTAIQTPIGLHITEVWV